MNQIIYQFQGFREIRGGVDFGIVDAAGRGEPCGMSGCWSGLAPILAQTAHEWSLVRPG